MLIDRLAQDIRYAARGLRKDCAFTVAAVLTIAFAVGLNTAIFSVTNAVLLRALPYRDPDRLMLVGRGRPDAPRPGGLSEPEYYDWLERNHVFSEMAAMRVWFGTALVGPGTLDPIEASRISSTLLPLLGVQPILGRNFLPGEEQAGRDNVVILSEGAWQRFFGGDPTIIGKRIRVQDGGGAHSFEVVGVTPRSFRLNYGQRGMPARKAVDVLRPLVPYGNRAVPTARRASHYTVYARLKPGVTAEQARLSVEDLQEQLKREFPSSVQEDVGKAVPLHEGTVGSGRRALLMLSVAVGLVLLLACSNVSSLLLSRSLVRRQEISIRTALGAGWGRLFQQLVTENLLLALVGSGAGLLLAFWGIAILEPLVPADLPRGDEIGVDRTVLAFAVIISIVSGLVIGMVPAWRAAGGYVMDVLRGGGGSTGDSGRDLRRALVSVQVAIVVVLLCGAGLMLNSVWRMVTTDLGFDSRNVATLSVWLAPAGACSGDRRENVTTSLLHRIRSLPAVIQVAAAGDLPFATGGTIGFHVKGDSSPRSAELYLVDAEYLSLMRYPIRRGRLLDPSDRKGGHAAVVNEAFARQVLSNADPVGRQVVVKDTYEIVGVVGDHREILGRGPGSGVRAMHGDTTAAQAKRAAALPAIYIPWAQADFTWCVLHVLTRTQGDPRALFPALKAQVSAVDSALLVRELTTLDQRAGMPVSEMAFYTVALTVFAAIAVVLAAVGIFGLLAQLVAGRVREIGLRMALGAGRRHVVWSVTSQLLVLVGAGVGAGLVGALLATRVLASFLFDITPSDPTTYAVVILALALVAAAAAWVPARRAVRVDPMVALRCE